VTSHNRPDRQYRGGRGGFGYQRGGRGNYQRGGYEHRNFNEEGGKFTVNRADQRGRGGYNYRGGRGQEGGYQHNTYYRNDNYQHQYHERKPYYNQRHHEEEHEDTKHHPAGDDLEKDGYEVVKSRQEKGKEGPSPFAE
jgi:hypothetical protein